MLTALDLSAVVEAANDAASDQGAMRVLLADDHPTNRKVIELILSQLDVALTSVENGAQAVDAFDNNIFDLVLMDMQMPVLDGLAATQAIRDLEVASGRAPTPLVMLTANALPEHVEAGRKAGADRHLSKPVSVQALLDCVRELTAPGVTVAATKAA